MREEDASLVTWLIFRYASIFFAANSDKRWDFVDWLVSFRMVAAMTSWYDSAPLCQLTYAPLPVSFDNNEILKLQILESSWEG